MRDARHPVEEGLETTQDERSATGTPGAAQPAARAQASSPGASAPGGDGHARRPIASDAEDEQQRAATDEDALKGDVDELVAVAAQRDEYLALAQRTQADFENYRKRVAKESAAAQERGLTKLATELLPALDNLDRALAEAGQSAERDGCGDALLEGVRLVRSELHAALARVGIESYSPAGAAFDPAEHEAMAQRPAADADSGTVVEVFQPGYRLGPIIIRPARVVVAA
jgi:molecular chaperone GrpE